MTLNTPLHPGADSRPNPEFGRGRRPQGKGGQLQKRKFYKLSVTELLILSRFLFACVWSVFWIQMPDCLDPATDPLTSGFCTCLLDGFSLWTLGLHLNPTSSPCAQSPCGLPDGSSSGVQVLTESHVLCPRGSDPTHSLWCNDMTKHPLGMKWHGCLAISNLT